ncbi:adenylate/guanylate cyclase domain-containing protein [Spirochaetota bacterium]
MRFLKKIDTNSVFIVFIMAACILLAAACASNDGTKSSLTIKNGLADASNLPDKWYLALDGDWEFYWNRFVVPGIHSNAAPLPDGHFYFPSNWKSIGYGVEGYCSYKLEISGLKPDKLYGIKASSFLSAAAVYANGELLASHGIAGRSKAEETPSWVSTVSALKPDQEGKLDIIVHVSNFTDRNGGSYNSIFLGDYDSVLAAHNKSIGWELFKLGALAAMGLYYLSLFMFRKKEQAAFWFGMLCLNLAFRELCYNEYFILVLFPGLPFKLLFVLGYLTFTLSMFYFSGFLHRSFPLEFPLWMVYVTGAVSFLYSLVVIFATVGFSSRMLFIYQIFAFLLGLTSALSITLAIFRKRSGARLFALGYFFLFAASLYDILLSIGIIRGIPSSQLGLLSMIFFLSLIMTRRFAAAFTVSETVSSNLVKVNKALERFVPRQILGFLNRKSIEEVELGDSSAETMAIMFVDIRSFTRMAEGMSPEEAFTFINEYLARIGPSVRANGGFVDKYLGDGFMALFPEGAEAALKCAIDIQARMKKYNIERKENGLAPFSVGIALHSGQLMLGTIGEAQRMDSTVVSDTVNVASRLEGVAKEYGLSIAASEKVLAKLEDPTAYRMRFIGKVRVKGKTEPSSVFEIYEGDDEEVRAKKDLARSSFERGVDAYYERKYGIAKSYFSQVLEVLPTDEASYKYIHSINKMNPV